MSDPWSALQGAGLGAVALAAAFALIKWLWGQREKVEARSESQRESQAKDHEVRIATIEKQLITFTTQFAEQQKDFGKLESDHGKLHDRLDGLQKFWREEFEKLADKMTDGMDRLRIDVRKDFEEHRQLVHDRMGEATRNMIATVDQVLKQKRSGK
jgi:predicted outer membrane lipoprotein